jgi:hypothetical protein
MPTSTATPVPNPTISLNPTSGTVGKTISVVGSRFSATSSVKVYWNSVATNPVTSTVTNSAGAFVATFKVPQATIGNHHVIAVDQTTHRSAVAVFTVKPALVLSPAAGHAGTAVSATGSGYGMTETVQVLFDCPTSTCAVPPARLLGSATTNFSGTFSLRATIPTTATPGMHLVGGKGLTSTGFVTTTFTVN